MKHDQQFSSVDSSALFGLYVVGEGQPNPEDWSPWSEWSLVIARSIEEAQHIAERRGVPCCRIPMVKALHLVTMQEPKMGSDL
jgi:type IV secretory pathway protease TraF